jgi:hypothetical protein
VVLVPQAVLVLMRPLLALCLLVALVPQVPQVVLVLMRPLLALCLLVALTPSKVLRGGLHILQVA